MAKKILLSLIAVVAVAGGVAAMSAYEAHVINVTAHIENALGVNTNELTFGTVFPQEYILKGFTVSLSDSFMGQDRVQDVQYKIVQKPKCECILWDPQHPELCPEGQYLPVNYWDDACPTGYIAMPDLCEFLSKIGEDEYGTVNVPSYFHNSDPDYCAAPGTHTAEGNLHKCLPDYPQCGEDITDCWTIDLKVPPVAGYEGQDWPETCSGYTVPTDGDDYGCDLWIEVTGITSL